MLFRLIIPGLLLAGAADLFSSVYEVGPGKEFTNIREAPLESLGAGDTVKIFHRPEPYREKWVIAAVGTESSPVVFQGVPGPGGERPVIDGDGAVPPPQLNYWNEVRNIIKVGGSSTPGSVPAYVIIENLDIKSARPAYRFTDLDGQPQSYADNAAAIHIEEGSNITIRNCILRDCANGLFSSSASSNILVEYSYIHNNGIEGSIYQHNNYTESRGITFQFNRFGFLRQGCPGNNLKDRSGGCVIRYNWIEGGNRQLDLVDTDYDFIYNDPSYNSTYVYGNVLLEHEGEGNSQVVHYGGDSGDEARYRKGTLLFYHNTVVSTRTGNTTLVRLSSTGETADIRNNILFVSGEGSSLALKNGEGSLEMLHNWLKPGWQNDHSGGGGVTNAGGNLEGSDPGFQSLASQDFRLAENSPVRSGGTLLHSTVSVTHPVLFEYLKHQNHNLKLQDAVPDMGAYEFGSHVKVSPRKNDRKLMELRRGAGHSGYLFNFQSDWYRVNGRARHFNEGMVHDPPLHK